MRYRRNISRYDADKDAIIKIPTGCVLHLSRRQVKKILKALEKRHGVSIIAKQGSMYHEWVHITPTIGRGAWNALEPAVSIRISRHLNIHSILKNVAYDIIEDYEAHRISRSTYDRYLQRIADLSGDVVTLSRLGFDKLQYDRRKKRLVQYLDFSGQGELIENYFILHAALSGLHLELDRVMFPLINKLQDEVLNEKLT